MELINQFYRDFESHLNQHSIVGNPISLYEPANYILSLGGKRLRPVFALMGCYLYKGSSTEAMNAAMGVEVFHNFTLLHDDIMDNATLRRGKPTVHIQYNTNAAILTGDVMMIKAYQYILDYEEPLLVKKLMEIFNKMAFEVCEGQQLDMDFENRNDVIIQDYLQMITWKTSVLLAASIQLGALIGGADESNQKHIYEFAKNFGIAFQLQDDILDTFGDPDSVGKKIGGDILQNKKTYLYLKSLELADVYQKSILTQYYSTRDFENSQEKIDTVTSIFKDLYVTNYAEQLISAYKDLSISHLMACDIDNNDKSAISAYIEKMIFRAQ
jgi:geranylgeranyl diphosphate synthase type II